MALYVHSKSKKNITIKTRRGLKTNRNKTKRNERKKERDTEREEIKGKAYVYTRRFAQEGKKYIKLCEANRGPRLEFSVFKGRNCKPAT